MRVMDLHGLQINAELASSFFQNAAVIYFKNPKNFGNPRNNKNNLFQLNVLVKSVQCNFKYEGT